jgi:hypothetical protein
VLVFGLIGGAIAHELTQTGIAAQRLVRVLIWLVGRRGLFTAGVALFVTIGRVLDKRVLFRSVRIRVAVHIRVVHGHVGVEGHRVRDGAIRATLGVGTHGELGTLGGGVHLHIKNDTGIGMDNLVVHVARINDRVF